jgi:hypothetical protein
MYREARKYIAFYVVILSCINNTTIKKNILFRIMVLDIGFSDMLSIVQTIGIVATLLLTLYYYTRQIQKLSTFIETQVLNDLDEKVNRLNESMVNIQSYQKSLLIYHQYLWMLDILLMCLTLGHMPMTCGKEKYLMTTSGFAGYIG